MHLVQHVLDQATLTATIVIKSYLIARMVVMAYVNVRIQTRYLTKQTSSECRARDFDRHAAGYMRKLEQVVKQTLLEQILKTNNQVVIETMVSINKIRSDINVLIYEKPETDLLPKNVQPELTTLKTMVTSTPLAEYVMKVIYRTNRHVCKTVILPACNALEQARTSDHLAKPELISRLVVLLEFVTTTFIPIQTLAIVYNVEARHEKDAITLRMNVPNVMKICMLMLTMSECVIQVFMILIQLTKFQIEPVHVMMLDIHEMDKELETDSNVAMDIILMNPYVPNALMNDEPVFKAQKNASHA